ncbi:Ig-like domain-containing protein, partial [Acinetobacter rudis]
MKQLIIESNGVKTNLDVNNINQLIREQGKLILKLADGKEIILNQSDVFSIELLDNNQGIISINSLSQSDEIDELEKLVEGDKISWFEENKALSYAGGALLVGGIVAAASSGGSSSDNGDYDPPSLLTQSLAADHKTVTGQTEAGATVKAVVNGKVVGSAVAGADGKYSLSL